MALQRLGQLTISQVQHIFYYIFISSFPIFSVFPVFPIFLVFPVVILFPVVIVRYSTVEGSFEIGEVIARSGHCAANCCWLKTHNWLFAKTIFLIIAASVFHNISENQRSVQSAGADLETMGLFWCRGFHSCPLPHSAAITQCTLHHGLQCKAESYDLPQCSYCTVQPVS